MNLLKSLITKKAEKYQVDDVFYLIGKAVFVPVVLFGVWFAQKGFTDYGKLFECQFRRVSGFPCPGCGGTRAFYYLFRGEIAESFKRNPVVIYGAVSYLHFMLWMFIRKHSKRKREPQLTVPYYLYGTAAVLLLQWSIKVIRMVVHFMWMY